MAKKTKLNGIFIVVFVLGFLFLVSCGRNQEDQEDNTISVEVMEVMEEEIVESITMTVQLLPERNATIIPRQPGLKVTSLKVKPGDRVHEGDLLFQLDKTLARKQIQQAKLNYDLARENHQTQRQMLDRKMDSNMDIEVLQNRSLLPAALFSNPVQLQNRQNPTNLENSLAMANMQLEEARRAYIASIDVLRELEFYSPMDGVVSQILIAENQIFMGNAPAMVISTTDRLKGSIYVTNAVLNSLQIGDKVLVKQKTIEKEGIITALNTVGDLRSGLHLVEFSLYNKNNLLLPGSFAEVSLIKNHKSTALVIDKAALLRDENGSYVFVYNNGYAEKRIVKTGVDGGDRIEVVEGLKAGEKVLTKGQHYVQEKTPLQIRGYSNEDN